MPEKYANPKKVISSSLFEPFNVIWKSPSNIALIKYWGKRNRQIPSNPSISFTLSKAHTQMEIRCNLQERNTQSDSPIDLELYFEGQRNLPFKERIQKYLSSITPIFPFLNQLSLEIHTSNSFPHSSGIASSASSMSALANCLCDIDRQIFGEDPVFDFEEKASYLARLASGSASRSIYPIAALWGFQRGIDASSDEYAIPMEDQIHHIFHSYRDAILVVSDQAKKVGSSAGHELMEMHPFAKSRFETAGKNLSDILVALKTGDVETVGIIAEREALMLHALMMTSNPSYLLMDPNTIEIINRVRSFRERSHLPLYFTLDAGPNVHLLYPESSSQPIEEFIKEELLPLSLEEKSLFDHCGSGPEKLN